MSKSKDNPTIKPPEMKRVGPIELHGGVISTTTDVWSMLIRIT